MIKSFAFAIGFIVCFALGLYAGKRRANGDGWMKIIGDLCADVRNVLGSVWQKMSSLFRKGKIGDVAQ